MDKLEMSERLTAAILEWLAAKGVERSDLTFEDLNHDGRLKGAEGLFMDAIIWLKAEGIIRGELYMGRIATAVVTSYGFNLLGQKLVGSEVTVGEAVRKVNAGEGQYVRLGSLLGGLLGGFTKSLG